METDPLDPKPQPPKKPVPEANWWVLGGMVGQLGYIIAIPAVIFAIGGAYLDTYTGLSPLFVLLGLSLAFLTSSFGVGKFIKTLLEMDKSNEKPKEEGKP